MVSSDASAPESAKRRKIDADALLKPEPLLTAPPNQYVFTVTMPDVYEMYQKAMASYWTPHELDFHQDVSDWDKKLGEGERKFIGLVLGFFAASDGIVNENLVRNFCVEVPHPEVQAFYNFQSAIETVHQETYANMLRTFVRNPQELDFLVNSIQNVPSVARKADLMKKYMNPALPFDERVSAFAHVEGVLFSASFASIFFMKKRGLMPGLATANTLIARDEGLHSDFACLLFKKCVNRPTQEAMHRMSRDFVEAEEEFVRNAIPVALIGMNEVDMCAYVRFVADRLLRELGYDALYNVNNPFDFMTLISVPVKTNFFEARVAEYNKSGVTKDDRALIADMDF